MWKIRVPRLHRGNIASASRKPRNLGELIQFTRIWLNWVKKIVSFSSHHLKWRNRSKSFFTVIPETTVKMTFHQRQMKLVSTETIFTTTTVPVSRPRRCQEPDSGHNKTWPVSTNNNLSHYLNRWKLFICRLIVITTATEIIFHRCIVTVRSVVSDKMSRSRV